MEDPFGPESMGALTLVIACFFVVLLAVYVLFLFTLQRALARCASRTMSPGQVWLLLLPVFSMGWIFVVVSALADSLQAEFARRGIPVPSKPGKTIGYAYAILGLLSVIPFVGFLTSIPTLICWGLYWAEIAKYSGRLDLAPAAPA